MIRNLISSWLMAVTISLCGNDALLNPGLRRPWREDMQTEDLGTHFTNSRIFGNNFMLQSSSCSVALYSFVVCDVSCFYRRTLPLTTSIIRHFLSTYANLWLSKEMEENHKETSNKLRKGRFNFVQDKFSVNKVQTCMMSYKLIQ